MPVSRFSIPREDRVSTSFHVDKGLLAHAADVSGAVGLSVRRALQLYARECGRAGFVTLPREVEDVENDAETAISFNFELGRADREAFKQACQNSGVTMKQALTRFLVASAESGGLALTMKVKPDEIRKAADRYEYALAKM